MSRSSLSVVTVAVGLFAAGWASPGPVGLTNHFDAGLPVRIAAATRSAEATGQNAVRRQTSAAIGDRRVYEGNAVVSIAFVGLYPRGLFLNQALGNAFATAGGTVLVTAEHCVAPIVGASADGILAEPLIISRYCGDVFVVEVLATDKKSDVALLRAPWKSHPALDLATEQEVSKAEEVVVVGYPLLERTKTEETATIRIPRYPRSERLSIVLANPQGGNMAIGLGDAKCVGPGWSGSPMILPGSEGVAGVFSCQQILKHENRPDTRRFWGCDVRAVRSLLKEGDIPYREEAQPLGAERPKDADCAFDAAMNCLEALMVNDSEKAVENARTLARLRPHSVGANLFLGWSAMGRYAANRIDGKARSLATGAFQDILDVAPDNVQARAALAFLLTMQERYEQARIENEKAIELAPTNPCLLTNRMAILGEIDPEAAVSLGRQLVETAPRMSWYWDRLSGVLTKLGRHNDALDAARKATDIEALPHFRLRLAEALGNAGHIDEAERLFAELLQDSKSPLALLGYTTFLVENRPDRIEEARKAMASLESRLLQGYFVSETRIRELRRKIDSLPDTRKERKAQ